ncbi:hypothetical protein B046DRAFT_05255 [Streptomyces sp. LamerLS-316]|nr:hypothetical protein B046DRAFT_05255 [Streptomyces sp. LamerLS-316]
MDTPQISAPPCARAAVSGVIHSNVRHTAGFTVIGNHLAQHRGLSLVAIGLAAHIQSLPEGGEDRYQAARRVFPGERDPYRSGMPSPPTCPCR